MTDRYAASCGIKFSFPLLMRSLRFVRCVSSHVPRDARFASLSSDHVAHFRRILGADDATSSVLTGEHDTAPYTVDWLRKYRAASECRRLRGGDVGGGGVCVCVQWRSTAAVVRAHAEPSVVLRPRHTAHVSAILKYCNEQRYAL